MFDQYSKLFWCLNDECQNKADEDLSLLEDAMSELVNSWTDYMMSRSVAPTDEEFDQYNRAVDLVSRW